MTEYRSERKSLNSMMGGSDSLPLLRKVAKDDNIGVEKIGKAIRWMTMNLPEVPAIYEQVGVVDHRSH